MTTHFANVTEAFALVTATGAGVLALLNWEIFKESSVGRAVFALMVLMSVFIVYHAVLFSLHGTSLLSKLLKSGMYTILVVFIALMIDAQRRVRRTNETERPNR